MLCGCNGYPEGGINMNDDKTTLNDIKSGKGLAPINTASSGNTLAGFTSENRGQNFGGFRSDRFALNGDKKQ